MSTLGYELTQKSTFMFIIFSIFLRKSLLDHPLSGAKLPHLTHLTLCETSSMNIWMTRFTMVSTFFWSSPFSNFTSSIRSLRASQVIPGPMPKCGLIVAATMGNIRRNQTKPNPALWTSLYLKLYMISLTYS